MPTLTLKHVCGVPKYLQLANAIRRDIVRGRLKAGDKLPSVRELADYYDTTKVTVSQAMDQLAREDLIEQQQGRGSFVKQTRSKTLAIVCGEQIADPNVTVYCSLLLAKAEKALSGTGWRCKSYVDVSGKESAEEFERAVAARRFDGLIVYSQWVADNCLSQLAQMGIPYVGAYPYQSMDRWVFFNSRQYALTGVVALTGMGARRIALIAGEDPQGIQQEMEEGFRQGLAAPERPTDTKMIRVVPTTEEDGFRAFNDLWSQPLHPDGIVITDELITKGVIRGLIARGVKVPEELHIASQVTIDSANPFALPVIQLQTDVTQQAAMLVQMIVDQAAGQTVSPPKVLLLPKIHNPFERKLEP
jgi:DNA-binding LacI/PurR family transcriptional regulator